MVQHTRKQPFLRAILLLMELESALENLTTGFCIGPMQSALHPHSVCKILLSRLGLLRGLFI
jgi:hypothetical protein